MGSSSEGEDQFFDTRDEISSLSDSSCDCSENFESDFRGGIGYEVWVKSPGSIRERRNQFLKWMGLNVDQGSLNNSRNVCSPEVEVEIDRIMADSGAVLQSSSFDERFSSSGWSSDSRELIDGVLEEKFMCRIRSLDSGIEFILDEVGEDGTSSRIREVGTNRVLTMAEFERSLGLSPLVQRVMRRDIEEASNSVATRNQVKMRWLKRLGVAACIVDRQMEVSGSKYSGFYPFTVAKNQIVKVRSYKKRCKEFSALYTRQDIRAHEGSIRTLKFSPDGQYLASAGEDGIVRVWQVMESERSHAFDTFHTDPSHVYFVFNNEAELVPLNANKETKGRFKSERTTSDSACVIFPHKVFQLSEKPIHEFYGHSGEVLDLSWSTNKCLLSSSTDKTVRLWRVGCDRCVTVFSHNNYVTCVQFNPVDENYFVSGSIDGKIRIWEIPVCQVVDWIDIAEIVTAACYQPDGKGVVVGSITGNCRFYDATDNHLQLNAQVCLQGKKKSAFKRITGLQYSPLDPTRLLVTSADSKIRVLHGVNVICKYEGLCHAGSQISASFSWDGMHIMSASEDSNVCIWNYVKQDGPVPVLKKNWSFERFFSNNISVAIPWCGMTCRSSISLDISGVSLTATNLERYGMEREDTVQLESCKSLQGKLQSSSPSSSFSVGGFFSDSLPKGSATWPAEALPPSSQFVTSAMCKSQYKFLKASCQSVSGSPHAWGMVIVTAGWDGRIRAFQNYGFPIRS